MSKHLFKRSMGLALALLLVLSALPVTARAAETPADTTELVYTDVTLDQTDFEYTGNEIKPNVTVRVDKKLLTLDKEYQLEYADNVSVGTAKVIVTGIATGGYTGTVEIPFYIHEKTNDESEYTLVEITSDHVTLEGTEFPYTGEAIEPAVTVTVDEQVLTAGEDYSVEYVNNIEPGTATVIVSGIATATEVGGYTGEVRLNFTIQAPAQSPVEITKDHVTLEGTEFPYTGKAIEPKVTVTVEGKTLTAGKDYSVKYEDNVNSGTGYAIVTGMDGYTGTVKLAFTIQEAPEYSITKGNGAKWYLKSTKNLSFTADGAYSDFIGVSVDGERLEDDCYTAKKGSNTVVTLKNSYLKKLEAGKYAITLHFTDGEAEGTFHVVDGMDPTNPSTGDNIRLWAAMLFMSLTGLAGTAFVFRKKIWK